MPYKTISIEIGSKYDRLTTTGETYLLPRSDGRMRSWVDVICTCGSTTSVLAWNLRNEKVRSCGCLQREVVSERMTTHGHAKDYHRTRLLRIWGGMKRRCDNPDQRNYKWYGGKGITYTADWKEFEPFLEWALSASYSDGLELDRIDSDRNYEPTNCRWVTKKQNLRNRDHAWSDELDSKLIQFAASHNESPYEVIRRAVEAYIT